MGPSGQFVSSHGYRKGSPVEELQSIWNPGVYEELRETFRFKEYEQHTNSLARLLETRYPIVAQSDFDRYGEVLVDLTQVVRAEEAHLNLGLLRGAYRPCAVVEVMTQGQVAYEFLNYTRHTEREGDILPMLREVLKIHDPREEEFRIQVTDTAIGGNGSEHLAQMLTSIKESERCFREQHWTVSLNLLHDRRPGTNTGRMRNIEGFRSGNIGFDVRLHEVPNLITEDYDGGLGLVFDGKVVQPCHEPGHFVLQSNAGVSLVESSDLRLTFDQLFSQAITDGLVTSPDYKHVGDIWNRQQEK